jgi:hypothetical protein
LSSGKLKNGSAWLGKNRMKKYDKKRLYFKLGSKSQIGVYPADGFSQPKSGI